MRGGSDNAAFVREVGHPVTLAIVDFGQGRYAECVQRVRAVRSIASRFGGSHAQRDVIDLTMLEAALRSGRQSIALALAAERAAARPHSPLTRLFAARAGQLEHTRPDVRRECLAFGH